MREEYIAVDVDQGVSRQFLNTNKEKQVNLEGKIKRKEKKLKISGWVIIGALIISFVIPSTSILNVSGSAGCGTSTTEYFWPDTGTKTHGDSVVTPNTSMLNLSVSAGCKPVTHIQPRTITTNPGGSFYLSAIVNSCQISTRAIGIKMTYPSPAFTCKNLTYQGLLGKNVYSTGGDNGAGLIDYIIGRGNGNPLAPVNGTFATIWFTVGSNVPPGVYQIWFQGHIYDLRNAYNNQTPRHCANITVVASGTEPSGEPKIDIQPRTFSTGKPICLTLNIDSCDISVKSIGIKVYYTSPMFNIVNFTYQNLLGANVLQVGAPSAGDHSGLINYAVTRILDNPCAAVNGDFVTVCFASAPVGTYLMCFKGTMVDCSGNALDIIYQCANITVIPGNDVISGDDDVISGGNCTCIRGDCNCDCRIDIADLSALGQAWGSCRDCGDSRYRKCLDCNDDGIIDIADLGYFGQHWGKAYCECDDCNASWCDECDTCPPPEPATCYCRKGDCDGDGDVDAADSTIFYSALGSCYPDSRYRECCDFDEDGCIGLVDSYRMDRLVGTKYCNCNECTPPWEPWP